MTAASIEPNLAIATLADLAIGLERELVRRQQSERALRTALPVSSIRALEPRRHRLGRQRERSLHCFPVGR